MSADREKLDMLLKRVDELVLILSGIVGDLKEVSAALKSMAVQQITQPPRPTTIPSPPPLSIPHIPERSKAIEDIKTLFPDDLENLLSFEEREDSVIIKPRQFLGSDNFSKIASIVRGAGGDYVSAGKASHFRVRKAKT